MEHYTRSAVSGWQLVMGCIHRVTRRRERRDGVYLYKTYPDPHGPTANNHISISMTGTQLTRDIAGV